MKTTPQTVPTAAFGEGDMLPDVILPGSDGKLVRFLDYVTNKRQVLVFCPDPRLPSCRDRLQNFARFFERLDPLTFVIGITATMPEDNAAFLIETPLPYLMLSDYEHNLARGLGVEPDTGADAADGFAIVVCDVSRRVMKISPNVTDPDPAQAVLDFLESLPERPARSLSHFAPVLYVPGVFEPDFCRALVAMFEAGQPQRSGVYQQSGELGQSGHHVDLSEKARTDVLVTDPGLLQGINRRLGKRIQPEVDKAFSRRISGAEQYKIVRYDAAESGHFTAHRDNVLERHLHRRFAITLNLNTDEYDGGELAFPEYGADLYKPGTGDAVVFSCSLLHEVRPVTRGQRYVFLAFFFDEESRKLNDRFRR